MMIFKQIWDWLKYIDSFSREEREQKRRDEEAAYHYVWVQREREKARARLQLLKEEFSNLIEAGESDDQNAAAISKEIELKERLINSKVLEIGKSKYNSWILEGYEKEIQERARIAEARSALKESIRNGSIDSEQAGILLRQLDEKESIMDRFANSMPAFPIP